MSYEVLADEWIAPYWNALHLVRTRDYAAELGGGEAVRLAALTHDIERHFPGGPQFDPATMAPDDEVYNRAHSERSAAFVTDWLRGHDARDELVARVAELVRLHEWGGTDEADIVQAADSLSFFEVNWEVTRRWVRDGRASPAQARAKLDWMLERIRLAEARSRAVPMHEHAVAKLEVAA